VRRLKQEVAVILASHGNFAIEALNSLEMIMGKQQNIQAVSLHPGEGLTDLIEKMDMVYQGMEKTNGTIIISDIFGGSPSNAATALYLKHLDDLIAVFTGLNLGILIELASIRNRDFNEVLQSIDKVKDHIWLRVDNTLNKGEEEEEL
jgi:mannose PTS system EIIA component